MFSQSFGSVAGTWSGTTGPCIFRNAPSHRGFFTTGAGDHFNSGFCLGRMLGFDNRGCLLTGVTTSGYYVRTGQSPDIGNLAEMLRDWPE